MTFTFIYHIYLNAGWGFPLNLGSNLWRLNSCTKCQTGLLKTGPFTAKPRFALPNHVRSPLFWDITRLRVVCSFWRFRMTYQSSPIFNGKEIQKREHCMTEVAWHIRLLWVFVLSDFLKMHAWRFRSQFCFAFSGKEAPNIFAPLRLLSITGHHRNSNLSRTICTSEQI